MYCSKCTYAYGRKEEERLYKIEYFFRLDKFNGNHVIDAMHSFYLFAQKIYDYSNTVHWFDWKRKQTLDAWKTLHIESQNNNYENLTPIQNRNLKKKTKCQKTNRILLICCDAHRFYAIELVHILKHSQFFELKPKWKSKMSSFAITLNSFRKI